MQQNANGVQDLQIFLSRASGAVPMVGGQLPTILATGPMRDGFANEVHRVKAPLDMSETFPNYVAVGNSEAVENVQLPFSPEFLEVFLKRLANDYLSLRECIDFGALLFDAIFQRSIRDQLRSLESKGRALRLTIATAAPELLILPWELLCDTQFGVLPQFLCQRQSIRLARSLRLFNRSDFKPAPLGDDSLRIMLVTASPPSLGQLDNLKEEAMLRFVLDETPALNGVSLHVLHEATVNELRKQLDQIKPHIVHISCHGHFDQKEGLGHIALCADNKEAQPDMVNAFRFASLLREPNSVRLVFLSTCQGAAQDPIYTFSGMAECLHANGIPAVAALQFRLYDFTGHAIALNFYRHLLRDRLSAEESVTRLRQYLFLNNHMISECFGLVFFQDNCSLSWQTQRTVTGLGDTSARSDAEYQRAFEASLTQKALERLSTQLDQVIGKFADLDSLTAPDLALTYNVFGEIDVALSILRDVRRAGIPFTPFLKMTKLASVLCQTTYEHEQVTTSLLLQATNSPDEYMTEHASGISEKLDSGFFWGEIKRVVGEAIKVNGTDRAFAALTTQESSDISHEHIRNLKGLDDYVSKVTTLMGDPKWKRVFAATLENGCAFILPARSRIKVIVKGEQIAEYRHGKWTHASLAALKQTLPKLAEDSGIDSKLLNDVVQKALVASDLGSGRTFVVQQKEGNLPRLVPGYKNIPETDGSSELKTKNIMGFEPVEYLQLIEGDGAVIISFEGQTLAINAKLAPDPTTQVSEIVSAGTRHLSAQKITKESSTIAVVVSDDGPVTIFFQGKPIFRKP